MIPVLAEAAKSTNSAAAVADILIRQENKKEKRKCGERLVVELDQMKLELQAYESPLAEVRDSL